MDFKYLTLFFSKSSGKICSYCANELPQDMSYFGENEEDFSIIWDYVVLEYNPFIMKNLEFFKVNPETKELIFEQSKLGLANFI